MPPTPTATTAPEATGSVATVSPDAAVAPESTQEAPAPTATPTVANVSVGHTVGQRAPDFFVTTIDGREVTLADYQGRPVVLYFFATG